MKRYQFSKIAVAAFFGVSFSVGLTGCNDEKEFFDITIAGGISGGSITSDKSRVTAGEDVVLSLHTDEGMVLKYVTVNGVEISFYDGEYTLFSVSEDCKIDAEFISSESVIRFVTGTSEEIPPKTAVLYEKAGELPVPEQKGKGKFLGWYDAEEGGNLIKKSSLVKKNELVLYAHWEEFTDEYLAGLVPYSITNTVYSSQLDAYGISFHTENAAVQPQILIAETDDPDFSEAIEIDCFQEYFYEEYVSQGVIDIDELSLVRGKKYLVKVGDSVSGVFSESFTFTVRELSDGESKFVYITDTQQDYHDKFYTSVDNVNYENGIEDNFATTLLKTAVAQNPDFDFIAHGGDVVNYGAESSYWAEMLGDLADIMFEYPIVAAAGNHESPNYYASNKFNLMSSIFNVNIPEFGTGSEEMYVRNGMSGYAFSFDAGPLHFVVLNSNDTFYTNETNAPSSESLSNAQLNWLRADLGEARENEEIKFTVAMIHEGPIVPTHSANTSTDHYKGLRGPLLKELRAGKVDLTICGHNHYYFSSYPIDYDENASTQIVYSPTQVIDEKYAEIVTMRYSRETVNGIEYNTFTDYVSGEDGTVFMEIGAGGSQNTDTYFPFTDMPALIQKHVFYRFLLSQGKNCIPGAENTCNNMYSYIKVTDTRLTIETYAANFNANYGKNFSNGNVPEVVLIDTLLLQK